MLVGLSIQTLKSQAKKNVPRTPGTRISKATTNQPTKQNACERKQYRGVRDQDVCIGAARLVSATNGATQNAEPQSFSPYP